MFKGIVSLALEAILFCFFYSLWNPMFENRREQERCELILKSITEEKCEQGLYTYLSKLIHDPSHSSAGSSGMS